MCFHLGECCILTNLSLRYHHNGRVLVFNSICSLNFGIDDSTVGKAKKQSKKNAPLSFCPSSAQETNKLLVLCASRGFSYIYKQASILVEPPLKQSHTVYIILHLVFLI